MPVCRVVGYREGADGCVTGPHYIRRCSGLSEAKSLCLACLWIERDNWFAVSIVLDDWSEVVRFRRFPPGRQRVEEEGADFSWGESVWRRRTKGARLSLSDSGRRRKSFGGNRNERSGFEGI